MGFEQNTQEEKVENTKVQQDTRYTTIVVLLILSLLFSITSLSLTVYNIKSGGVALHQKEIKISEKYDNKGWTLDKAVETKKPILVFFYADWCGFCQRFAPTFHKITRDAKIKENFAIAYVNCDAPENAEFTKDYGITAFPTVYVVDKEGKRTQLDNNTFFNPDSKTVVRDNALELIGAK